MTEIEVNGRQHSIAAAPEAPLLYVLSNELGLVGTRFGCGSGQCGACYVLVDGRAMASCDLPVSFVAGKKVTTIEGLGDAHPVQKALVKHLGLQSIDSSPSAQNDTYTVYPDLILFLPFS